MEDLSPGAAEACLHGPDRLRSRLATAERDLDRWRDRDDDLRAAVSRWQRVANRAVVPARGVHVGIAANFVGFVGCAASMFLRADIGPAAIVWGALLFTWAAVFTTAVVIRRHRREYARLVLPHLRSELDHARRQTRAAQDRVAAAHRHLAWRMRVGAIIGWVTR